MTRKDILFASALGVIGLIMVSAPLVFALLPVSNKSKEDVPASAVPARPSSVDDVRQVAKTHEYQPRTAACVEAQKRRSYLRKHPEEALAIARKEQQLRRSGAEPSESEFTEAEQKMVDRMHEAAQSENYQTVRQLARAARRSKNISMRREAVSALSECGKEGLEEMLSDFGGDVPEVTTEMLDTLRSAIIEEDDPTEKLALAKRALTALTDEADRDIIMDEISDLEPEPDTEP